MTNGSYVVGGAPLDHGYAAGADGLGSMRKNLLADVRTHLGGEYYDNGEYENIAIALLGSHELLARPTAITFDGGDGSRRTAVIQYQVTNDTTLASATRVGYNSPDIDRAKNWIAEGSFGGRVSQEFVWYERYTYDYQGN